MGFTDKEEKFIQQIYDEEEERETREEEDRIAEIQARVNRELKAKFGLSLEDVNSMTEEDVEKMFAEEEASEQRIEKSRVDAEQAPLSPSELSNEARVRYNKLIENGADPNKALAWIDKHSTGTFDDFALKALSNRLLSDQKLQETAEYAEGKRLMQAYWSELQANGQPTDGLNDYFEMNLSRSDAREAIARDKAIKAQEAKEADAIEKAKIVVARGTFVKWHAENRKYGIETNLEVCAEKLGVDKKDLKGLL